MRARVGHADSQNNPPTRTRNHSRKDHPSTHGGSPGRQNCHAARGGSPDPQDRHAARGGSPDPQDRHATHGGSPDPQDRHATHAGDRDWEDRPLLLVDIDGVISLFAFEGGVPPGGSFHSIEGIPHFLSSTAAGNLLRLAPMFELAWASGWEEKANEYLPHLLGLPTLPYLSFEGRVGRTNAHWKLDAIDAYAGMRPLAWIDDAFNEACHEWASVRQAPTLLVQTMPASGLTRRETQTLERWARTLGPA